MDTIVNNRRRRLKTGLPDAYAALNKLQIHASSSCVYFEDERFSDYARALWLEERARLTTHAGLVVQAPDYDAQTREALGDIVHAFQPQLAYRPLLTLPEA